MDPRLHLKAQFSTEFKDPINIIELGGVRRDLNTYIMSKTDLAEKLRKKKQSPNSTQHKFFICLDNAEELITHAGEEFRDFISKV